MAEKGDVDVLSYMGWEQDDSDRMDIGGQQDMQSPVSYHTNDPIICK